MYVCMYVCLFVCLFACLFVCMHVFLFACVCLFVCLHVCLSVCLYVHLFVLSNSVQTHCLSAFHSYTCLSAVTPDKHNTNQDTKSETPTCHINLYPHCCTRPSLTIAGIALVHTIILISDIPDHEVRYHIDWPSIKTLSHVVHVNGTTIIVKLELLGVSQPRDLWCRDASSSTLQGDFSTIIECCGGSWGNGNLWSLWKRIVFVRCGVTSCVTNKKQTNRQTHK